MSSERRAVSIVCLAVIGSCAGVTVAAAVARLLGIATFGPAAIGTLVGIAGACTLTARLARRLPDELDGWFARRRFVRWLWALAAVLAIVNTARIGLFAAAPSETWASAFPIVPESARHQCLAAYVRAGELAANGQPDLWKASDYLSRGDRAATSSTPGVRGLAEYLGDPYEYPPTFAVLPRAAIAATDDYELIRVLWFGISGVGFWLAFVALAIWIRGRAGATSLLLAPAVAISFPLLFDLQWGQAHLLVVAASIAAMIAFSRGRTLTGGALLGFAIATKIFPGLLLVHLAVRRQWRALAATLGAIAVLVGLAAVVLGPATLGSFVSEHLPRMASGEAFAYTEQNPDNHSLYSLGFKLGELGLDVGRGFASSLAWAWSLVALALAALASRGGNNDRARDAVVWLAIICLATLRSPFAPMYTAIGTLWLLSVWIGVLPARKWIAALVAVSWVLLQGAPPVGSTAANVMASMPSQIATIAIAVIAAWPRRLAPLSRAAA